MTWSLAAGLALGVNLVALEPAYFATDCKSAVDGYRSVLDDIDTYLKRYVSCISGSRGKDDCFSEFSRLKSAQDDFESVVRDLSIYCRQ